MTRPRAPRPEVLGVDEPVQAPVPGSYAVVRVGPPRKAEMMRQSMRIRREGACGARRDEREENEWAVRGGEYLGIGTETEYAR
jgi:hypothetical protein